MVWGELRNWCEYFCTIGLSLILQSIGFCVPNWVTTETCDAIGLFYRCCGKNDTGCVVDGADTCKTFLLYIYFKGNYQNSEGTTTTIHNIGIKSRLMSEIFFSFFPFYTFYW